jgi:hypothetical protein
MDHPQNEHDEDGGTFKLKPSAGQSQPQTPDEGGLDSTMKLRPVGGATPPGVPSTPPPPPSPLGGPTGPASPSGPPQTQVFPPSGAPQTQTPGFPGAQPGQPTPPPGRPQGPPQGQPYGQTPPPGQYPPPQGQQPYGQQPANAQGAVLPGLKRISLLGYISGGAGLFYIILLFAMSGGSGLVFISGMPYILTSVGVIAVALALPRGMLHSKGMRIFGIVFVFAHGAWSLFGLLNLLNYANVLGGAFLTFGSILLIIVVAATGYSAFIYFKDKETHAWFHMTAGAQGRPAAAGMPPAPQGRPGMQQGGYPQQPGQPGGYPPPPGAPPGQQPPQPPYGR